MFRVRMCAYQEVGKVSFSENFAHVLSRKILRTYILIPSIYNIPYFARLFVAK